MSRTHAQALELLAQDAKAAGQNLAHLPLDYVLCEDGRTTMIYAGDNDFARAYDMPQRAGNVITLNERRQAQLRKRRGRVEAQPD